jgi:4-alpha-glucanotransferase
MQIQEAINHWQRLGGQKDYHGVATPLLSLRSNSSLGGGDFEDLRKTIDWLSSCKVDILQLLPLNDTGFDPSPYSAISAFSLNPIYIHLDPKVLKTQQLDRLQQIEKLPRVPYTLLRRTKLEVLRELVRSGWGKEDLKQFSLLPCHYLRMKQYALFMALKDHFNLLPWWQWPENLEAIKKLPAIQEASQFYLTLQAVAHSQLVAVAKYAQLKGIKIFGDLPILICRDSSEVYFERVLFNLDVEAGAPPDQYSQEGQKWGFPIYNWSVLSANHYQWWHDRLHWAENYFDLYRLDHIAGFFAQWSIEPGKSAKDGFHLPKDPEVQLEIGQARLKVLLDASELLPVGEDLGYINPQIRERMSLLSVPGIRVMRWHLDWQKDEEFIALKDYPRLSLCCLSTHDSLTLRQWWNQEPEAAQKMCRSFSINYQRYDDAVAQAALKASHQSHSCMHINLLGDYLDAFSTLRVQDPDFYRINTPGTINDLNWSMRYQQTIEELAIFTPLELFWRSIKL